MNRNKKIAIALSVSLLAITSLVLAKTDTIKKWWVDKPEVPPQAAPVEEKIDPAQVKMLEELATWMHPFDSTNTSYYLDGLLTAVDKTDSAHAMIDVPYTYLKEGDQFYLRNGQTETINTHELFLMVDHEAQRMIVTKNKESQQVSGLPLNELYNHIKEEGYTIQKKSENNLHSISMINSSHISMKEFSVQYDSSARHVKKIFFRQPDFADPGNPDMEKWMSMVIKSWNDDPRDGNLLQVKKFITRNQQGWSCTPAYKDYELMIR